MSRPRAASRNGLAGSALSRPPSRPSGDERREPARAARGGAGGRRLFEVGRCHPSGRVSIAALEPHLLRSIPVAERRAAQRALTVTCYTVPAGAWDPRELYGERDPWWLWALRGAVYRDVCLGTTVSSQLFSPGSIVSLREPPVASLPWQTGWGSVIPSVVAVLDSRFPLYARRWPALSELISERLGEQFETAICQAAIAGMPRVDERIIALFWHLGDDWGRVGRDGITIELPLTHRLIGRLVGAERTTVSLALARLSVQGLLSRDERRIWTLSPNSVNALVGEASHSRLAGRGRGLNPTA